MRILVTGITGAIGSRLAPRLLDAGHEVRALTRRRDAAGARARAGGSPLTDRRCRLRDRPAQGAARRRGGLLPDPLDGAGLGGALRGARAAQRPRTSPRPPSTAGVRRIVYLGGLRPAATAAIPAPRQPARGRAHPARGGARLGRAAGLDRDRRPLALVPLPGPSGRAHAGAGDPGLARAPHSAGRRTRRAHLPRRAPPTASEAGGRSLDLAGPDVVTYGELIERIRDQLLLDRPVLNSRDSRSRRSPAGSQL